MSKKLRAAGYCRTSSESQRDNASIPFQENEIEAFIKREGWMFLRHYVDESRSGSKIEGREAFADMMRDAANDKFDLLVVFDVKRFGRDGADIIASCRTLSRIHEVYVVDTKGTFDTRDPRRVLANYVQAGVAEEERLSILERTKTGKIANAKNNRPNGPRLPHGRLWDKEAKEWSVDPEKKAAIEDAAKRYLAGESMDVLAEEVGLAPSNLWRTFTQNAGETWIQRVNWGSTRKSPQKCQNCFPRRPFQRSSGESNRIGHTTENPSTVTSSTVS
jgi:site-specific DNA recombinase